MPSTRKSIALPLSTFTALRPEAKVTSPYRSVRPDWRILRSSNPYEPQAFTEKSQNACGFALLSIVTRHGVLRSWSTLASTPWLVYFPTTFDPTITGPSSPYEIWSPPIPIVLSAYSLDVSSGVASSTAVLDAIARRGRGHLEGLVAKSDQVELK
jgi:hypothetical protein